jgi:hypothetical protein
MLRLKVLVLGCTLISAAKAGLHCEDIWDLELTPHRNSGCRFLAEIVRESGIFKRKVVAKLGHQVREKSGLMRQLSEVVPVHKYIFLATVAVQITVKYDFSLFLELTDEPFNASVFGVQDF